MSVFIILRAFEALRYLGIVETKRQFAMRYLGRAGSYVIDLERRGCARTPLRTIAHLRARLLAIAGLLPQGMRAEIEAVVTGLDRDTRLADWLAR